MFAIPATKQTIVVTLLLLAGLLVNTDLTSLLNWIQILGICVGFVYICFIVNIPEDKAAALMRWIFVIGIAAILLLIWHSQNAIVAIYLVGATFLTGYFIACQFNLTSGHRPLTTTISIAIIVSLILICSPTTISRIEISLINLPVPSKFWLYSDDARQAPHTVSKGFGMPTMHALKVHLNADNVGITEPMPSIRLQGRHDTLFSIDRIRYKFLHVTVHQLLADNLSEIKLGENSDEVILEKIPTGILISDVNQGESVWLDLPDLDSKAISTSVILKTIVVKVFVWLLACTVFFSWAPGLRQASVGESGN